MGKVQRLMTHVTLERRGAVITMPSGAVVDLRNPDPATIELEDIATSIAKLCRFAGHVSHPYSVAEHCVLVGDLVAEMGGSPEEIQAALVHDGHEGYVGDVIAPVRAMLGPEFDSMTDRLDRAIGERFGLDPASFSSPLVERADHWARIIESDMLAPWLHVPGKVRNNFPGLGVLPEKIPFPLVGHWSAAADLWTHATAAAGISIAHSAGIEQTAGRAR